ncbi:hypothetical protein PENSUB_9619 [Penicillium subrubescens]|uniref:Uncharacterized protein n=1 Tax=Penicillium subrubescens TaxID=1316194 RepID=A0A1Q5TCU0_9EURO|nr:hypothetical protein PENSUB_9619 [Penicillium subrubescens]
MEVQQRVLKRKSILSRYSAHFHMPVSGKWLTAVIESPSNNSVSTKYGSSSVPK